jgi:hypothetical protein
MGPNKATSLVWGQWDLNIAGRWVQLIKANLIRIRISFYGQPNR